jgi:hypothetical protein
MVSLPPWIKYTIYTIVGLFVYLTLLQHVANINKWTRRPSDAIDWVAEVLEDFWRSVGEWWAWISSFVEYLHITELLTSMSEIVEPIWRVMCSWMSAVIGYGEYIDRHQKPAIIIGSLILLGIFALVIYKFYYTLARIPYLGWIIELAHRFNCFTNGTPFFSVRTPVEGVTPSPKRSTRSAQ